MEAMLSSAKLKSPPISVLYFCSCHKVDHKQEVRFILLLLGQIVTCHNPIPLD